MSLSKRSTDELTNRFHEMFRLDGQHSQNLQEIDAHHGAAHSSTHMRTTCPINKHSKPSKLPTKTDKTKQTLKKYCTETSKQKPLRKSKKSSKKLLPPSHRIVSSSLSNKPPHPSQHNVEPKVDIIKENYAHIYGKPTDNIIQLYNFYKMHMEKSGYLSQDCQISGSNHSTSTIKPNNTSMESKLETKSLNSRNTPSLISQKNDASGDQQCCKANMMRDRLEKESTTIFLELDQEQSSALSRSTFHNQSISQEKSIQQRLHTTTAPGKTPQVKNTNHKPIQIQHNQTQHQKSDGLMPAVPERQYKQIPAVRVSKRESYPAKKEDHCNLPLQQRILRIDTETDPDIPKGGHKHHEVRKFDLNLAEQMSKPQKPLEKNYSTHQAQSKQYITHNLPQSLLSMESKKIKISSILHDQPPEIPDQPAPVIKNQRVVSPPKQTFQSAIRIEREKEREKIDQKSTQTQTHTAPLPPLPLPAPAQALTNNINIPTQNQNKWHRPATGTPRVTFVKGDQNAFTKISQPKSLQRKMEDEQAKRIWKKNMELDKRKKQINQRLKRQHRKSSFEDQMYEQGPAALNEVIFLEQTSGLQEEQQPPNNFAEFQQFLSKHDLSLWQNMNMLEQMYSTGEIRITDTSKQNLFAEMLQKVKQKKKVMQSKYFVPDVPELKHFRKTNKVEVKDFSPQQKISPVVRTSKQLNQLELEDCEIIGRQSDDSMLREIEAIQLQL